MGRQPGALTLSEDDRRVLAAWAAACAARTLPLFEAEAPNDPRPRAAVAAGPRLARPMPFPHIAGLRWWESSKPHRP
jgi:hypothetical protein